MSTEEDNYDILLKLVMIGDSGVGKTNILSRYINNEFSLTSKATIGVEFCSTIVKKNGKLIKLQIWDTAGQERYKSITSAYYKGAKGAFVVYDITRAKTFKNIDRWILELKANGNEDILIVLIGNKLDLEKSREVLVDDVKKKAEELKVAYFETSALDGSNIEHAFDVIVDQMVKKFGKDLDISNVKKDKNNKAINIDVENKNNNKGKKSLFGCTSAIIKILFKNKTPYKHIQNCLEQILNNINTDSTQDIITKVNESILFCFNASNIKNNYKDDKLNISTKNTKNKTVKNVKMTSRNLNNISKISTNKSVKIERNINLNNIIVENGNENNDERNGSETVNAPFIKKELDKKFCLVLDIDETLSHMINLPFGNYFLVRPGVIDLLKELYIYYEIDIFTAALKHYADNILNKLDRDNCYISYRLYRCHCTYENGKSVKKLDLIGRDLNKIVFVDDLKRNAKYNMKNLALVSKWIDDLYDNEIINLKNKLKYIALCGKYDDDITRGLLEQKITEDINN